MHGKVAPYIIIIIIIIIIRPTSEEDHPTVEPCNPEPENPSLPETTAITEEPEDNTDDYEQLKEEYLKLLEDTKSQPMKKRKKLPNLK